MSIMYCLYINDELIGLTSYTLKQLRGGIHREPILRGENLAFSRKYVLLRNYYSETTIVSAIE